MPKTATKTTGPSKARAKQELAIRLEDILDELGMDVRDPDVREIARQTAVKIVNLTWQDNGEADAS